MGRLKRLLTKLLLAKSNFLKRRFKRPMKAKILLISRFFLSCKIKQRCLLRLVSKRDLAFDLSFQFFLFTMNVLVTEGLNGVNR